MGAALYFLLFPSAWDTSFLYIRSTLGTDGISQLENSGISVPLYAGISVIAAITYAPLVNMFFAVGEEAGWRGTMYPQVQWECCLTFYMKRQTVSGYHHFAMVQSMRLQEYQRFF